MPEAFETMYINEPVFGRDICCCRLCCWQANSSWYACIHVRRGRVDTELGSLLLTRAEQSGVHVRFFLYTRIGF